MNIRKSLAYLVLILMMSPGKMVAQDHLLDVSKSIYRFGGIERMDTTKKFILLTFTGGDFGEGTLYVQNVLKEKDVLANFFFTGDFYRNHKNRKSIKKLIKDGHYLGAHSDKHLLYASWENRDSLLVTRDEFKFDLIQNYMIMEEFGLRMEGSHYFMPAYEWYNDSISSWTHGLGHQLVNYTPGTRSNADYTTPDMASRYVDSEIIMQSIFQYEQKDPNGLNGFILLLHVGTDPRRTDKFYYRLPEMLDRLQGLGYQFLTFKNVF